MRNASVRKTWAKCWELDPKMSQESVWAARKLWTWEVTLSKDCSSSDNILLCLSSSLINKTLSSFLIDRTIAPLWFLNIIIFVHGANFRPSALSPRNKTPSQIISQRSNQRIISQKNRKITTSSTDVCVQASWILGRKCLLLFLSRWTVINTKLIGSLTTCSSPISHHTQKEV